MSQEWFKDCKSIAEVYATARKLRERGEDVGLVNTAATVRKKELITATNQVSTLTRILPKASTRQNSNVSSIVMEVLDLNSGVITITRDNKILI